MNRSMRNAGIEEDARLAALGSLVILDTPPERGFDDIVQLARRLCDVPVALISLVDRDRQWFKARAGFPACETGLDQSVCKFVLSETGILQIPDLTRDPRTRGNPLVTGEPHLRFYAGAPLRMPRGHVLGSLCVIDHAPRPTGLTATQAEDLEALARQVMDQLLLRRCLAQRASAERQRAAVSTTLADVAAAGGDLDASLRAALAGAMRAIPSAEAGAVEMRETDTLVCRAATDGLEARLGLGSPVDDSDAGFCLKHDKALLIPDLHRDGQVEKNRLETPRLRSSILVPIRREGRPIGVLKLQSSMPNAFTDEDLQVVEIFAGTISAGLAEAGEKAARKAVRREERRYAAVFDSAIDHVIVIMDREGCITEWNEGAIHILGWTPDEAWGQPAGLIYTPEDRAAGIPAQEMDAALRTGSANGERWHVRKDGTRFFASGEIMVLRDEDGANAGFLKILRDRTERHEAGLRLAASQQRYRLAARATNDAIWDWDLATGQLLWNEALADAYGHATETVEPTGDWWIAHIHPEDRARIDASIHAIIDGTATTWTDEYRFLRADGSFAAVLDRGYVIRDGEGRAIRMIGAMSDLTERKRAEGALRKSERNLELERGLLRAIFDQAPIGISVAGATSEVPTLINVRAEAMLGHGAGGTGEARYGSYGAIHADGRSYQPDEYPTVRVLRTGVAVRNEEMRYRNARTGEVRRLEVSSGPVQAANGTVVAAVTVFADVENQRRAEAEAHKLAAIVEQSRDFVGIATPDGRADFVNDAGRRLVGLADLAAARNTRLLDYFVPEEHSRFLDEVLPATERDGFWEGGLHFRNFATGEAVPVHYSVFPVRDGADALLGYGTVARDLSEQHRVRQALMASEASLRAVLDTVPVGILFAEAPSGRIVGGNRRLEEMFRHPIPVSSGVEGYDEWVAFHEDGRRIRPHEFPWGRIIRDGAEHAALECEYQRGDGTRVWVEIVGVPMKDDDGTLVGGVFAVSDIDARRRAEAQQQLLNHELSHRMKNLLAMVQAIATSTLRGATDMDATREVLANRLVALGKAHDMLLGGMAERAPLALVVREGVGAQEAAGDRVLYEGPNVEIGGRAALSLALTLHELTTNAIKYGALSVPDGRVAVSATLEDAIDGPCLRIAWTERGGPPVSPPSRKGFGSRLIERGLTAQVGARLALDYRFDGVTCVIEAPLANFQAIE